MAMTLIVTMTMMIVTLTVIYVIVKVREPLA